MLNLSGTTLDNQTIDVRGTGSATSAAVYGEHRSVPISGGTISDAFGPYAVHIYEVPAH